MIEFGNAAYYIDLKAFDKSITYTANKTDVTTDTEEKKTLDKNGNIIQIEHFTRTTPKGKDIDAVKYSLLNECISYILDYGELTDDTLGLDRALSDTPLGYKIAFNTLLHEGIIKEK